MINATLRDLLNIFFRYIKYLVLFTIAIVLVAGVYVFGSTKMYTSKAKVLIRLGAEQLGSMQFVSDKSNIYLTRREQELKNELEILVSDTVLTATAKKIANDITDPDQLARFSGKTKKYFDLLVRYIKGFLNLEKPEKNNQFKQLLNITDFIKSHLNVKVLFESDTLEISFNFPNPYLARKILNVFIEEYINHHIQVFKTAKELSFLKTELAKSKVGYETLLGDFSDFMSKNGIYSNEGQLLLLIENRNRVNQSLIDSRAQYDYQKSKLEILRKIKNSLQPFQQYNVVEVRNRQYNVLQSKLVEAKLEKQNMLNRYGPDSRFIKDIKREIELLENLLSVEPKRVIDTRDRRKTQVYETIESNIIELESEVKGRKAEIASLENHMSDIKAELSTYAGNLTEFNMLKKQVEFSRKAYEKMFDGFLENRIKNLVEDRRITNIVLIEQPSLNLKQSKPRINLVVFMTILLILAGNSAIIVFFSVFDYTVTNPNELEKAIGLPVLGTIPLQKRSGNISDEDFLFKLYKRNTKELQRCFINLTRNNSRDKVFLFSKSQPFEGGTTITTLLSLFFKEYQYKKTAFVDFAAKQLLSSHHPDTDDHVPLFSKSIFHGITLFSYTGQADEKIADLENKFSILEKLKKQYDYVFVNIPAVGDSHEFVFLSRYIDKVVFIVAAESVKTQIVKYNLSILAEYGFNNIVTILNKRKFYIPRFVYKLI